MRRIHQLNPGTALCLLATAAALAVAGCAPGTICDKPEYEQQCAMPVGGSGGGTGGTGGSGGSGGSGGGGSGGGGAGGGMMVTAATMVANCPTEFNTLGKMDAFFGMRCGHDVACHTGAGATAWTDMKMMNVFSRLLDVKPKFVCLGQNDKMIDPADWQKSMLLVKVRDMAPKCANGSMAGPTIMPPPEANQGSMVKQPPLSAAEKTCLENFVRVAAGR